MSESDVKEIIRLQADHVRGLRIQVKQNRDYLDKLKKEFEAQNGEQILLTAQLEAELEIAEADLRQEAVEAFQETGDKRPGPGVEVKLYDILSYDQVQAFEWARHSGLALKLDKPVFEKIAKADKPEFVTITQEPRALIATDLEKALANQEEKK